MSYKKLNSAEAILEAIQEYKALGREKYFIKYHCKPSTNKNFTYFLCHEGLLYECKPIFLGAYYNQFGYHLASTGTKGIKKTLKPILEGLGFSICSEGDCELPIDIDEEAAKQPKRSSTHVNRIIRNSQIAEGLKQLYNYKCQICNEVLEVPSGLYAEGAHIKPLGSPHNGPDTTENLLCLCPNHHLLFDKKAIVIQDDFILDFKVKRDGHNTKLTVHPLHKIDKALIKYHREVV
ncbi:HNH endonuclease [Pseudoalteromonas sp. SYSU M81236]|uniref:HNH endonuclease n=1 Tax=Pseudoalteromonas sp. SYSU M81236 TaxID=3447014 RepID=UPI003EFCD907